MVINIYAQKIEELSNDQIKELHRVMKPINLVEALQEEINCTYSNTEKQQIQSKPKEFHEAIKGLFDNLHRGGCRTFNGFDWFLPEQIEHIKENY